MENCIGGDNNNSGLPPDAGVNIVTKRVPIPKSRSTTRAEGKVNVGSGLRTVPIPTALEDYYDPDRDYQKQDMRFFHPDDPDPIEHKSRLFPGERVFDFFDYLTKEIIRAHLRQRGWKAFGSEESMDWKGLEELCAGVEEFGQLRRTGKLPPGWDEELEGTSLTADQLQNYKRLQEEARLRGDGELGWGSNADELLSRNVDDDSSVIVNPMEENEELRDTDGVMDLREIAKTLLEEIREEEERNKADQEQQSEEDAQMKGCCQSEEDPEEPESEQSDVEGKKTERDKTAQTQSEEGEEDNTLPGNLKRVLRRVCQYDCQRAGFYSNVSIFVVCAGVRVCQLMMNQEGQQVRSAADWKAEVDKSAAIVQQKAAALTAVQAELAELDRQAAAEESARQQREDERFARIVELEEKEDVCKQEFQNSLAVYNRNMETLKEVDSFYADADFAQERTDAQDVAEVPVENVVESRDMEDDYRVEEEELDEMQEEVVGENPKSKNK